MNFIWGGLMLASILCALATGRMGELSGAVLSGASDAIQLVISMLGLMCLWTGLMRVAEKGGLTAILAKLFSPVMAKLFPDYEKDSPAVKAICMNITANLLGLGNAATPMGIAAMKEMARAEGGAAVCRGQWYGYVRGYQYRFSAIDPHNDVGFAGKPRRGLAI